MIWKIIGKMLQTSILSVVTLLTGMLAVFILGFIMAWPIKWAWNYAIVSTFALPAISWGKAWCLAFLAGVFIKSSK